MDVIHLMTQRDQPYGSVRRCCEVCGTAISAEPKFLYTDDSKWYFNETLIMPIGMVRCFHLGPGTVLGKLNWLTRTEENADRSRLLEEIIEEIATKVIR